MKRAQFNTGKICGVTTPTLSRRWEMTKILTASLLLLTACNPDLYGLCAQVSDCDPAVADACATLPGQAEGTCTVICKMDSDYPKGPKGEKAVCKSFDPAGIKACSLP